MSSLSMVDSCIIDCGTRVLRCSPSIQVMDFCVDQMWKETIGPFVWVGDRDWCDEVMPRACKARKRNPKEGGVMASNFLKVGQRVPLRWSLPLRSISDKATHYMPIRSCLDCRNLNVAHCYTPDSFEVVFDWFCGACGNKKIDTAKIPDWCPLPKMEK